MTLEIVRFHSANGEKWEAIIRSAPILAAMRGNVNGAINQDTAWKSMSR